MALGSKLAHQLQETKKKDEKIIQELKIVHIDRCGHPTCKNCRKHTSCNLRPKMDDSCISFEDGEAWDHNCKHDRT